MTPLLFHDLLLALVISLLIQAAFFAVAATLRTDKVTDLSYGLTFIALALFMPFYTTNWSTPALVLTLMVVLWGARLAGYLFYRILTIERDTRFDGVRDNVGKFAQFWFLQGVVVWVIMLPALLWFLRPGDWTPPMLAGVLFWALGLVIETVADMQKFRAKLQPGGRGRWVDTGLWRLSRHPNYFGEMLCWWGIFGFTAGHLGDLVWLGAVGPLTLTAILLFFTGIPPLEKRAREKWGDDPAYQAYRERTRLLIPWPK